MMPIQISRQQACEYMTGQLQLRTMSPQEGVEGARALLDTLRCIQLDPLDRIGTNADLVAQARVEGLGRGDIYDAVLGEHGFEHFAKERCLLPARAYPYYREQLVRAPWYNAEARAARVSEQVLDQVLEQVREEGPVTVAALADHGMTQTQGWHGVKPISAARLAIEVLWAQCRVVVVGRASSREKRYDVPSRALSSWHDVPTQTNYETWALRERVEAAGLLGHHAGPHWSSIAAVRKSALPHRLADAGELVEVVVEGSPRRYWAPADALSRVYPEQDARMRVLGPLDPLLWDRGLVAHAFGFEYVWEVYKPAAKRVWGYYVCPLLYEGALVGRMEARREADRVVVERVWRETGKPWSEAAFDEAIARLEGCSQKNGRHAAS